MMNNFSFATMFSKVVCCYCVKMRLQVGKGYIYIMSFRHAIPATPYCEVFGMYKDFVPSYDNSATDECFFC